MNNATLVQAEASEGVRIQVDGIDHPITCQRNDTVLRASLRHGIAAPYECSIGSCGTCKMELVAGNVETLWAEAPGLTARDRARGRFLACQSRPLSDCQVRFIGRIGREPVAVKPRVMRVGLTAVREVTHDISAFTFQAQGPAEFKPGQYALIQVPGVTAPRAYSMSNLPNDEGLWEFIIRRVPGGLGTQVLFDGLRPGAMLDLDGPYGHAWLREPGSRDVVCIAGGSGFSPMLSIARGFVRHAGYRDRTLHFFFGGRRAADICSPDELPGEGRIVYLPAVSDPDEPADRWSGARGLVHEHARRTIDGTGDCDYYLAGPPPMVDATMKMLLERKVRMDRIHYDRFY